MVYLSLIIVLLIGQTLNQLLILTPLSWLHWLSLPNWLIFSLLLILFAWCFGE